jgi:hypothetical protein
LWHVDIRLNTYVTGRLCDITYIRFDTYVTGQLCDITYIRLNTYVTGRLCDITYIRFDTYVTGRLCDITYIILLNTYVTNCQIEGVIWPSFICVYQIILHNTYVFLWCNNTHMFQCSMYQKPRMCFKWK